MEGDVECGKATVLRGAVSSQQSSHGKTSRLQISVSANALFTIILLFILSLL